MKRKFYFLSYVDAILAVWRFIQRDYLILLQASDFWNLYDKGRHRLVFAFFFWEIIASTIKFSLKPPCFLEVMVLTFWFISIFQRNGKRFIQLQYIFLNCYMNKFPNQYLLFPHFPVLWNLHLFMWRVVSMLLRSWYESGLNLLSSI